MFFRFLHPGVLDKGNYSMFATPRPILPGEPDQENAVAAAEKVIEEIVAGFGLINFLRSAKIPNTVKI